jgi:murein DD-endopeptidase MepM/ murein hydrolase activator NlpD
MRRRSLLVSLVALALALAAPAAGDDVGGQKAQVDARIAALEEEIGAAKGREGVLTTQLSAVAGELRSAQSAVDKAQGNLDRLEGELSSERSNLQHLTALLRTQTRRLVRLQAEYRRVVHILEQRVRATYMDEPPDVLSFLVSASSFSDVLDNIEFLNRLGLQDQRIAGQVGEAKAKAAGERRATARTRRLTAATVAVISARTDEARDVRDELASGRDALLAAHRLKASALADARETREEYLAEVEGLEAQSAALGAQIQAAQSGQSSTGAVSSEGLIWPVNGPVTSGFGMRWGRMHTGIDIAVPTGTPVHASASGTVVYAGWMSGYGYLVAIDHGNGLATAYAHNSSLLVAVGQHVAQGDTISLSGSTGHSTGPHVHFEVRVNGVPVDPLLYL